VTELQADTLSAHPQDVGPELDFWRTLPVKQQPKWPNPDALRAAYTELSTLPPLVIAPEVRSLTDRLADVARGEAFLLQGGDCAETFAANTANKIRDKVKTLLQMAVVLTYGASTPVVKVARIAGQYAKPRSTDLEAATGLPSYRGDAVNGLESTLEARLPDPFRMVSAYHHSAAALNMIRAFATGGFASLAHVHEWNKAFVRDSAAGRRYELMATDIERALAFMAACGIDLDRTAELGGVELYTSHEGLLLEYERALTRVEEATGQVCDLSAHMIWIGERTRDLDGAHVDFLSRVANPLGCKIGPKASPDEVLTIAERLNPEHIPGRLTLITRMGAGKIRDALPAIIEKVNGAGHPVVWACDPMHGNTRDVSGVKTRHFDDVLDEVLGFFEVHKQLGTRWPAHRADRRERHGVPRWRPGDRRGRSRRPVRDGVRPAVEHQSGPGARLPRRRDAPVQPFPAHRRARGQLTTRAGRTPQPGRRPGLAGLLSVAGYLGGSTDGFSGSRDGP
jgi:3-deoxy-7-phosphoheptulonate synthase